MPDIVSVAVSQIGTKEKPLGSNRIDYNKWFYGYDKYGDDAPWCAVFISWCAEKAEIPTSIIPKTASSATFREFFQNRGLFRAKGSYTPKAGDIALFNGHVGIVAGTGDTTSFQTIEGNYGNRVQRVTRKYSDAKLIGFGLPQYGYSVGSNSGYVVQGTTYSQNISNEIGNYTYEQYTVKAGDTLQSIASKFGIATAMISFANNLSNDNVDEGDVLSIPIPVESSSANDNSDSNANITTKHTVSYDVYKPTLVVAFFGEYGKLAAVTDETVADSGVAKDVISITTSRSLSQDCATFSITLVYRNDWYNAISSNDLVVIQMQRPPEAMRTVFYGLVDDIRKTVDFSSGNPIRSITITGRGFNKAFVNFNVGLIRSIAIDTETGFFDGLMNLTTCSSYMAIQKTLDAYIGKAINYKFGNGKTFPFYFRYDGNERPGETLMDYTAFTTYSGSLWNFIKELGNAPFCETFWECVDEKPTLFHRRTPFNREDWNALPLVVIPDSSLVTDNTGRSDLETYTVYSVQMDCLGDDFTNIYRPLWYPPYYSKYGISQLEVHIIYDIGGGVENPEEVKNSYFIDLFNWNVKNALMANGTLVVKGSNQYTIGSRVVLESNGMEFYVEGVSQIFNAFQSWTTQLQVTRGIKPTQRFSAPWGMYEEMTDAVMSAIIRQTSGEEIDWANLPQPDYSQQTAIDQQALAAMQIDNTSEGGGKSTLIPAGYGTTFTYMNWYKINDKTSPQYKLRADAGESYDSDGFAKIQGRYVVACTKLYGIDTREHSIIGDYLTVYLKDGNPLYCIVGDIKNEKDIGCNKYGHDNGKTVIEFIVDRSWTLASGKQPALVMPSLRHNSVTSIVRTGNFWGD